MQHIYGSIFQLQVSKLNHAVITIRHENADESRYRVLNLTIDL